MIKIFCDRIQTLHCSQFPDLNVKFSMLLQDFFKCHVHLNQVVANAATKDSSGAYLGILRVGKRPRTLSTQRA